MEMLEADNTVEAVFTCRFWLLQAVRVLFASNIVTCPHVRELQREPLELAEANDSNVDGKAVRYKVHDSELCF